MNLIKIAAQQQRNIGNYDVAAKLEALLRLYWKAEGDVERMVVLDQASALLKHDVTCSWSVDVITVIHIADITDYTHAAEVVIEADYDASFEEILNAVLELSPFQGQDVILDGYRRLE